MKLLFILFSFSLLFSCSKKEEEQTDEEIRESICSEGIFGTCIEGISDFQYGASQLTLTKGDSPFILVPTYNSSTDIEFYSDITLPSGIVLNPVTGVISGSPLKIQDEREYSIVVRYSDSAIRQSFASRNLTDYIRVFPIKIRILDIQPSNLILSNSEISVERRGNMNSISILSSDGGNITLFEINPQLPAGLLFDSDTGTVSGSPIGEQQRTQYTIIAKNSGGQSSVDFFIEVTGRSPESLTYLDVSSSYLAGKKLTRDNIPIYSGDSADEYSINPELPKGVLFDTSTGIISGNPSEVIPNTVFNVTASNEWGSTSSNIELSTLSNITGISTGLNHTCIIKNKKVNCTGRNEFFQLGRNSFDTCVDDNLINYSCEKTFDFVEFNSEPLESLQIVSTRSSTCSLGEDNKVYCWGDNSSGQLGIGGFTNTIVPTSVKIDNLGTELTGIVKLDSGNLHNCASNSSGELYCWGDNSSGQLGSLMITSRSIATKVDTLQGFTLTNIEDFSTGYNSTCYIKSNQVYCRGSNEFFNLGDGTNTNRDNFVSVIDSFNLTLLGVKSIQLGRSYSLAINNENNVLSWGDNSSGQLANGNTNGFSKANITNVNGNPLNSVSYIGKGNNSFCYIKNGEGYCVGENNFNFGFNTVTNINSSPVPILKEDESGPIENLDLISQGFSRHRCVSKRGLLYCFGINTMGQLGDGSISDQLIPKPIITNE
jgi:alpha-tubulin suppressor-like RCC1 family protein